MGKLYQFNSFIIFFSCDFSHGTELFVIYSNFIFTGNIFLTIVVRSISIYILYSIGKESKINLIQETRKLEVFSSPPSLYLCEKVVGWASAWESYKTQHQTWLFLSVILWSGCWPERAGCGWKNFSPLRKNLLELHWTIL